MRSDEFDIIGLLEKFELLASKGVLIARRTAGCFEISLFQIGSFYVELYFHTVHKRVKLIRCFDDPAELSEYLKDIDISALTDKL